MTANDYNNQKFYLLKIDNDFFENNAIDFLMSQKNGANYVVLYQMLCFNTANTNGRLEYKTGEMIIPYDIDKIQRDCKYFNKDTITVALNLYKKIGLIITDEDNTSRIVDFNNIIKSFTQNSLYKKEKRKLLKDKIQTTRNFDKEQHIPVIDKSTNQLRYGGNYYLTLDRDKYKCLLCGSIKNLCVHHIDGYDKDKPENNKLNRLITLCKNCHNKIHSTEKISDDTLKSIGYYEDQDTNN